MLVGIAIASSYGPHPDRVTTLEEMYARGLTITDISILGCALLVVCGDLLLKNCPALRAFRPPQQSVSWSFFAALAASSCSAITSVRARRHAHGAAPTSRARARRRRVALALTHLPHAEQACLKIVATAVRATQDVHSLAPIYDTMPHVPLALLSLCTFAPLLLYLLNSSLGAAAASYAVPIYRAFGVVNGILFSSLVWREFDGQPLGRILAFLAGIVVILCSIVLLSLAEVSLERRKREQEGSPGSYKALI